MIKKKPFDKIKCKTIKEDHNPVCIIQDFKAKQYKYYNRVE